MKHKQNTLAKKDHKNWAAWQIDNWEKKMTNINKYLDEVLSMILDKQKTYRKYFN